jgi:hypothetical protein
VPARGPLARSALAPRPRPCPRRARRRPGLGLTPAQTRARGQALWTPFPAALALTLRALSSRRKGKCF